MHILIIPSWYKNQENPTLGSFFEEQSRALLKRGHQVGIFNPTFYPFSSKSTSSFHEELDNEIPTIRVAYKGKIPKNKRANYYLYSKKIYISFNHYVKQYGKPDIIHTHSIFYGGLGAEYIAKKENIPLFITEHSTHFITGGIQSKIDLQVSKSIFQNAQKSYVVSNGFKNLLEEKLDLNEDVLDVLPNMVHSDFFDIEPKTSFDREKPVFLTVSYLTERKNHDLMIKSFSRFVKNVPNAELIIGGSGVLLQSLKKLVEELEIEPNVKFLGDVSRDQVKGLMKKSDAFILGSKFETFGVVLIEALAAGIPVISTDSIGPRDIINSNNGILVEDFSNEKFYEALFNLYNHYEKYNKKEIKKDCKTRFSEQIIVKILEQDYLNALKN